MFRRYMKMGALLTIRRYVEVESVCLRNISNIAYNGVTTQQQTYYYYYYYYYYYCC
jgi:hypothetical protein